MSRNINWKIDLIWHILFLDAFLMLIHFGGMEVIDLFIHSLCLCLATGLLLLQREVAEIPRPLLGLFGVALGLSLIQLIPLPDGLFQILAPTKARLTGEVTALFPDVPISTEISVMPGLHLFKLASLSLDVYLVCLMIAAPRPTRYVYRVWLLIMTAFCSTLSIWEGLDLLNETSAFSFYLGTYGGLVNVNHYAVLSVLLAACLFCETAIFARSAYSRYKYKKPRPTEQITKKAIAAIFFGLATLYTLIGFQYSYSRSGVINFLIAFGIFALLIFLRIGRHSKKRSRGVPMAIGATALIILMLPLGKGVQKLEERGIGSDRRLNYIKVGMSYMSDIPVMGIGLGSTEGLLNQTNIAPPQRTSNAREYHNEWLQTFLELGPIGMLCLLGFLIYLGIEIRDRFFEDEFRFRAHGYLLAGLTIMWIFHSSVSFPLRVTALRVFALIVTFILLKETAPKPDVSHKQSLALLPLLFLPLLYFSLGLPKAFQSFEAESPQIERALADGRYHKIPFFKANEKLDYIFNANPPIEETIALLPEIKALAHEHLLMHPFSIKGLNMLFMAEVLDHRIKTFHDGFQRDTYQMFKEKALKIRELGEDANWSSRASLFFLYATYEKELNDEEAAVFKELKDQWDIAWNMSKRRVLKPRKESLQTERERLEAVREERRKARRGE